MKPIFLETWVDYFEVESTSTGYCEQFQNFDEADDKYDELRRANPADSFRFVAVISETQ